MSGKVVPIDWAASPERVLLVAVEPSADALGAALLRELRPLFSPQTRFEGCGGPLMEREGLESFFPIDALSVMGVSDVVRVLPEAFQRAEQIVRLVESERVDAVIFIDGWGFSRLCAARLKKRAPSTKLFKLGAPQVWASRPRRVGFVKKHFDGVLCLLPFEPKIFQKAGVRAAFIGNPNFQAAWAARGDGAAFRRRHDMDDAPLLILVPGSRCAEVDRLMPVYAEATKLLSDRMPDLRFCIPLAPSVADRVRRQVGRWPVPVTLVEAEERYDAFAAATAAIAKSGTVTTELAINHTPMAVAYKLDPLTALWARQVMITPFVTILNVTAGDYIVPEFLQGACTARNLAGAVAPLLRESEARAEQLEVFPRLLASLAVDGPPAAKLGAEKIREWMKEPV